MGSLKLLYYTVCFCNLNNELFILFLILISNPGFPPPRFLQESLNQWLNTDLHSARCGERMATVPSGALHFLGNCIVQDPVTGQLL